MNERYWLTGAQLAVISDLVREADPSLLDAFEVCDLLKLIEYDQCIEEEALITVHVLGLLDGLRLWLMSWLFKLGAIMAGYDVRLIIDDGSGVETMRWHAEEGDEETSR